MSTLQSDLANGSFIRTLHGSHLALGFRGPRDFIERAFNLCHNQSITKGRLHWRHDKLAYVLTDEQRLRTGLARQFYAELIQAGLGQISTDIETFETEYDEAWLEAESARQADQFIAGIESLDFLSSQTFTLSHVYSVGAPGRESAQ